MSKKIVVVIGAFLLALAAMQPAGAQDEETQCKKVRGHGEVVAYQIPCLEDPEFYFCIVSETRGGLKGKWVSYQQEDWGSMFLGDAGLPVPPGAPVTWYIREFEVFSTKKGTVYGDMQATFDARIFDSGGGAALPTIVTGGTGIYEDATGWIVVILTDESLENFKILGRICGPNIPSDDDDSDDD